jgi:DNA-binding LacI/PurR family transcriptional regulator
MSAGHHAAQVAAALDRAIRAGAFFDAILARDDRLAAGALTALRERGLAVPDDVAVVGWDDSAIARYTHPMLTSIAPDTRALAAEAFSLLAERMSGHRGPGRHRVVAHGIAVRDSAPA